jgi:hypothetical protein
MRAMMIYLSDFSATLQHYYLVFPADIAKVPLVESQESMFTDIDVV